MNSIIAFRWSIVTCVTYGWMIRLRQAESPERERISEIKFDNLKIKRLNHHLNSLWRNNIIANLHLLFFRKLIFFLLPLFPYEIIRIFHIDFGIEQSKSKRFSSIFTIGFFSQSVFFVRDWIDFNFEIYFDISHFDWSVFFLYFLLNFNQKNFEKKYVSFSCLCQFLRQFVIL